MSKSWFGRFTMFLISLLFAFSVSAQLVKQAPQPLEGFGGAGCEYEEVVIVDSAEKMNGYWLYHPADVSGDSLQVIVFLHGYGAINPMIYGGWIEHLVKKGNIVVYPRYQKNILQPPSELFIPNVTDAIKEADVFIRESGMPALDKKVFIGHSYGGMLAAYISSKFETLGLKKPGGILICEPGTGPLEGGRLSDYSDIPEDVYLIIVVGENDWTVGEESGKLIYSTSEQVKNRLFIRQLRDDRGKPTVTASHYEPYSLNAAFDSGHRNFSSKRAMQESKTDAVDYFCYWKLLDLLNSCVQDADHCTYLFDVPDELRAMGEWSDGEPIKMLEIRN